MNRRDRRAARSQGRVPDTASTPVQTLFATAVRLHQTGRLSEAADSYRQVLALDPAHDKSLQNLGGIAIKAGRHELAVELFRRAIALNDLAPDLHRNMAIALHGLGQWDQAIAHARRAVALKPDGVDAYLILGDALGQQGQLADALACFVQAVTVAPGHAAAHTHLGALQIRLGHAAEAEVSLRHACELNPDEAGAHFYLGNALVDQGRPQDAVECYLRAIAIKPDHMEAHTNICSALMMQSKYAEAIAHYQQIIAYKPGFVDAHYHLAAAYLFSGEPARALEIVRGALKLGETNHGKSLFAACLRELASVDNDGEMPELLYRALSEPWDRPGRLMRHCVRLVKADAVIAACMERAAAAWPAYLDADALYGPTGLHALAKHPLLRAMLDTSLVVDIAFERLFTNVRRCLLHAATAGSANDVIDEEILAFHASLARQCFNTEYVYAVTDEETAAVDRLLESLQDALRVGERFPISWLVAVAAYVPLHRLENGEKLLGYPWPASIDALLTQQLREPLEEVRLRGTIPALTPIEDQVSKLVRHQYEENPYPRWAKAAMPTEKKNLDAFLRLSFPLADIRRLGTSENVDILTAGCGTGQQLLNLPQNIVDARTLAVDLSLASLSYAKRQTEALGLHNIEFGQADILQLGTLGRSFDVIECGGVLHHLGDPEAGWRVLLSLLRPNGLMRIALYSELARRQIVAIREVIARRGIGQTADDIRRFRQELLAGPDKSLVEMISSNLDFFSISACRDLLFHVQEHRFTLPRIDSFLRANGLRFLGFELPMSVRKHYAQMFPGDPAMTDLDHWQNFEQQNPHTFIAMYQFWVQREPPEPMASRPA